jgi:hypothetical protein
MFIGSNLRRNTHQIQKVFNRKSRFQNSKASENVKTHTIIFFVFCLCSIDSQALWLFGGKLHFLLKLTRKATFYYNYNYYKPFYVFDLRVNVINVICSISSSQNSGSERPIFTYLGLLERP